MPNPPISVPKIPDFICTTIVIIPHSGYPAHDVVSEKHSRCTIDPQSARGLYLVLATAKLPVMFGCLGRLAPKDGAGGADRILLSERLYLVGS